MVNLFKRCLKAKDKYIHTSEGGDYYIEAEGDTLYLLFECSDGAEDWLHNFDFIPDEHKDREETPKLILLKNIFKAVWEYLNLPTKPYKDMFKKWRVHGGFLKVWKDMKDDIEAYVAEFLASHPEI